MKSRNVSLNCGTVEGSVRAARSGRRFVLPALMLFALGLSAVLTGCSANFNPQLTGMDPSQTVGSFTGKAHGGQAPIYNAAIFVFDTGHAGYPGSSVAANVSTITSSSGTFSGIVNGTYYGNYVLTNQQGLFTISGFTCTPGDGVYLVSVGGQPIYGTTNSSATEMAAMGICPSGGASALATSVPFVNINEVSTAAMAYALGGFTSPGYDFSHISTSATNSVGMATAFGNAAIMYNVANNNGANSTSPVDPTHFSMIDYQKLNMMANILADCVNSAGTTSSSSPCYILFQNASSNGTTGSGTIPQDTASAMINITHNVTSNVSTLYALASNSYVPYTPATSSTPSDFTYSIRYTNANNYSPRQIVIDSTGTIYAMGCNSSGCNTTGSNSYVTKISPLTGTIGSAAFGDEPVPAIDQSNNIFFYDSKTTTVAEYGPSTTGALGVGASGSPFNFSSKLTSVFLNGFYGGMFIIGPSNNLEIANYAATTPTVLNFPLSSGTYSAANSSGHATQDNSQTFSIAVDGTGTTWFANNLAPGATYSNIWAKVTSSGTYSANSVASASTAFAGPTVGLDAFGNSFFFNELPTSSSIATIMEVLASTGTGYISGTGAGGANYLLYPTLDGLNDIWGADCATGVGDGADGITSLSPFGGGLGNTYPSQLAVEGTTTSSSTSQKASCITTIDQAGNMLVGVSNDSSTTGFINFIMGLAAPTVNPLSLETLKMLPTNTSGDIRP